jgi:hypothetical protein
MKGESIMGFFDSFDEAYRAGIKRFRLEPFFVHEVRAEEPPLRIRGLNLTWHS